jgi:hypothetical protein
VETPVRDLVQGYTKLASSLLERWSKLASNAASKIDAGSYDATSAAEDLTAGATLAAEGGLLWAAEACEAVGAPVGWRVKRNIVTSQKFRAPAGSTLELEGPLSKGPELATLPTSVVTLEPPRLAAGETEFRLRADGTGQRGATYVGRVKATTDTGTTRVLVWITVP